MNKELALIDFGAGNLHSVYKAFKYVGANIKITKDVDFIKNAHGIVFPGVGAFGSVMDAIKKNNLEEVIVSGARSQKPFLGICVGMQVLFESGEEDKNINGLSVFKGKVVKFKKAKKIPHIGWNDVRVGNGKMFPDFMNEKFYFVHSYYVIPEDKNLIYTSTIHDGEEFCSSIKKDNLFATQFHPEKSGSAGLELIKNFLQLI